jgi:hypothetical protein
MRLLRITLVLISAFMLALVAGVLASSVYRRLRYPGVRDTDGLYDIGLVFIFGFGVVAICESVALILFFVRRRKSQL